MARSFADLILPIISVCKWATFIFRSPLQDLEHGPMCANEGRFDGSRALRMQIRWIRAGDEETMKSNLVQSSVVREKKKKKRKEKVFFILF